MNKRLKAKWVKALRSGKYVQGKEYLRLDGAFCCLGVLQDICPTIKQDDDGEELLDVASSGISKKVQEQLAKHNDDGKSFAWIASNIQRRKSL